MYYSYGFLRVCERKLRRQAALSKMSAVHLSWMSQAREPKAIPNLLPSV